MQQEIIFSTSQWNDLKQIFNNHADIISEFPNIKTKCTNSQNQILNCVKSEFEFMSREKYILSIESSSRKNYSETSFYKYLIYLIISSMSFTFAIKNNL
jgi:hypothetical protein